MQVYLQLHNLGVNMKLFLTINILLAAINTAYSSPYSPMFACAEGVIRDNYFLPRDEKRILPMITQNCSKQIDEAQNACELIETNNDDDCGAIINSKLSRFYSFIVNEITIENR
jgi:hypothetical protein